MTESLERQGLGGRSAEANWLTHKLGRAPIVWVTGPRGIGKTTIVELTLQAATGAHWIFLDARHFTRADAKVERASLLEALATAVLTELEQQVHLPPAAWAADGRWRAFVDHALPCLGSATWVFALDETDVWSSNVLVEVTAALRGVANRLRYPSRAMTWILIRGDRWGEDRADLPRMADPVLEVGPLDSSAIVAVCAKLADQGKNASAEALALIEQLTAGYPLALAALVEALKTVEPDESGQEIWPYPPSSLQPWGVWRALERLEAQAMGHGSALSRGESFERMEHALLQADPPARKMLLTVATVEQLEWTEISLLEALERAWPEELWNNPESVSLFESTLRGLVRTHMLVRVGVDGARHVVPMLARFCLALGTAKIRAWERPHLHEVDLLLQEVNTATTDETRTELLRRALDADDSDPRALLALARICARGSESTQAESLGEARRLYSRALRVLPQRASERRGVESELLHVLQRLVAAGAPEDAIGELARGDPYFADDSRTARALHLWLERRWSQAWETPPPKEIDLASSRHRWEQRAEGLFVTLPGHREFVARALGSHLATWPSPDLEWLNALLAIMPDLPAVDLDRAPSPVLWSMLYSAWNTRDRLFTPAAHALSSKDWLALVRWCPGSGPAISVLTQYLAETVSALGGADALEFGPLLLWLRERDKPMGDAAVSHVLRSLKRPAVGPVSRDAVRAWRELAPDLELTSHDTADQFKKTFISGWRQISEPEKLDGVEHRLIERDSGPEPRPRALHRLFPSQQGLELDLAEASFAREQRLLEWLGDSRVNAVPRLLDTGSLVDDSNNKLGFYSVVSEPASEREATSLRTLIRRQTSNGRSVASLSRSSFWHMIASLFEALSHMHQRAVFHRSARPDYVRVSLPEDPKREPWRVTLIGMEWSYYLRNPTGMGAYPRRRLDYSLAPETLSAPYGETFGTDLFSMGVLIAECLASDRLDLGPFAEGEYSRATQIRHIEAWLSKLEHESSSVRAFVRWLLSIEPKDRPSAAVARLEAQRQALDPKELGALPIFAHLGGSDPLASSATLPHWLRDRAEWIDQIPFDEPNTWRRLFRRQLCQELAGASIFVNSIGLAQRALDGPEAPEKWPLFLMSKSGLEFRLGKASLELEGEPRRQRESGAFLEVARRFEGDSPFGPPIGQLPEAGDIRFFAIDEVDSLQGVDSESYEILRSRDRGWAPLFESAEQALKAEQTETSIVQRRLALHAMLNLANEAEYELVGGEIEYVRVEDPAFPNMLLVREPSAASASASSAPSPLQRIFAAWTDVDPVVEVASKQGARAITEIPFPDPSLAIGPNGTVALAGMKFGLSPARWSLIPPMGVLRSPVAELALSLFRRRRRVLRELLDQPNVLDALADPTNSSRVVPGLRKPFEYPGLDDDKKACLRQMDEVRPLLAVRGPPGTGKTQLSLATLHRELNRNPHARIAVVAPTHDALDHLLESFLASSDRGPAFERRVLSATVVRIPSGKRPLDQYPATVKTKLPSVQAEELYRRLRGWIDGSRARPHSPAGQLASAVEAELKLLGGTSEDPTSGLAAWLADSANVLLATANSGPIARVAPDSFDLLIAEESGKCGAVELAGAMRVAPRWLMIGDERQLPAFGLQDVEDKVFDSINAASEAGSSQIPSPVDTLNLFGHVIAQEGPHTQTLTHAWRFHPKLLAVVASFYDDKATLIPGDVDLARRKTHELRASRLGKNLKDNLKDKQLVWVDFENSEAYRERRELGGGIHNEAERRAIVGFLRALDARCAQPRLTVLSFYKRQVEHLRGLLANQVNTFDVFGKRGIEDFVSTVDSFQGRQAPVVLLSMCRNNTETEASRRFGFLTDRRRGNVAFSRAESLLVIFGCRAHFAELKWVKDQVLSRVQLFLKASDILSDSETSKLMESVGP